MTARESRCELPPPAYGSELPPPAYGSELPPPAYGSELPPAAYGSELPAAAYGSELPAAAYGSDMPTLLYDGQGLLIVDKPAGAVVHRSSEHRDAKIVLLQWLRDIARLHVHPVNRIDRPTSGLVVFARDSAGAAAAQVRLQGAAKGYLALVRGECPTSGVIDRPLTSLDHGGVQEAVTRYERLEVFELGGGFGSASLVRVHIATGRRHQIRRHFSHLRHQLLVDVEYGKGAVNRHCRALGLNRLFLHCAELVLPATEAWPELVVTSPIPAALSDFLVRLRAG